MDPGTAVPSVLSLEPQTSDFSHMTLVHSILSLLEPVVSGCEQNFVCWPFKRVPATLVDFCLSLTDRISTDFHSQMLGGCPFLALALGWGAQLGVET